MHSFPVCTAPDLIPGICAHTLLLFYALTSSVLHGTARRMVNAEVHLRITRLPDAAQYLAQQDETRQVPSLSSAEGDLADQDESTAHILPR